MIHHLPNADRILRESQRRRMAASSGTLPESVTLFSFCTLISIARYRNRFVPVESAVHASLHAQFVDRSADVRPALPQFIAERVQSTVDRFAQLFANARVRRRRRSRRIRRRPLLGDKLT